MALGVSLTFFQCYENEHFPFHILICDINSLFSNVHIAIASHCLQTKMPRPANRDM